MADTNIIKKVKVGSTTYDIGASIANITGAGAAAQKGVTTSVDTSTNLVESQAVKAALDQKAAVQIVTWGADD